MFYSDRLILIAVMIPCLLIVFFFYRRAVKKMHPYDERQKLIQGRAFRDAYLTMSILLGTLLLVTFVWEVHIPYEQGILFSVLVAGFTVWGCETTLLFADVRPGLDTQKKAPEWVFILGGVVMILNMMVMMGAVITHDNIDSSVKVNRLLIYASLIVMMAALTTCYVIRIRREKKEDDIG